MRELRADIEIEAPAERVWQVLTDFSAYPQWNPFMTNVRGEPKLGSRFRATLEAPGSGGLRVWLRVTRVQLGREIRWRGAFPRSRVPGLVNGERVITLEPVGPDRVRLEQRTTFTGLMIPLLAPLTRYQPGLVAMNEALKARAEGTPTADGASRTVRKVHALQLFSGLPRQYDRMGTLLSLGQDPRWRRAMVAQVRASADDRVLDVATGTGLVARELVRRYGCAVVGLDQSDEMLAAARARLVGEPQLAARIQLVQGEAERLPFADREFDAVTFTYLLRYVDDPGATLRELVRVLRPGGTIASLEFGLPAWPLRAPWLLYARLGLPALGRLVSPAWYEVGRFLAPSISAFYVRHPLESLPALWEAAGISSVQVRRMSFGAGVVMWGSRADGRA